MTSRVSRLKKRFYPPSRPTYQQVFLEQIEKAITPDSTLLDLGAGRGRFKEFDFRGRVAKSCGVDVDPAVLENEMLDEARTLEDGRIPYPDHTFDVIFSRFVWEHLEHPREVFGEVHRVLKPGGWYLSVTPNRYHYASLVAACTPHSFHQWAVSRSSNREEHDAFPTYFRLNSGRAIHAVARDTGFAVDNIILFEGPPRYLNFNAVLYFFGIGYERLLNSASCFSGLRSTLIVTLQAEPHEPAANS